MYIKPQVNEADWKLFRRKLPDWQEACMDRLNHEAMTWNKPVGVGICLIGLAFINLK